MLLFRLLMVLLAVVVGGCSTKDKSNGSGSFNNNEKPDAGGIDLNTCATQPRPGCPCTDTGEKIVCGAAQGDPELPVVCGQGHAACFQGKWGDCMIETSVTIVPDLPEGKYKPMSLGQPTDCQNNPCDPFCVTFPDTPSGLGNDAGIAVSDAGLTLAGEGGSSCVPASCVDQGKNCGPVSDKCGTLLNCGTCVSPATCGGGGTPSVCGISANCTNFCLQQTVCSNPAVKTTLTGKVYAPNGVDPLPNAVVYVPNGTVAAFTPGVACEQCGTTSGSPLVSTTTDVTGAFTLQNVPATNIGPGNPIPLVIQIGRWRRQVSLPSVPACQTTAVAASLTRLPRTKAEGDIPKMAFVTGGVDAMECVYRKIGIADSEFTNPSGTGRVNFYAGSGYYGTYITTIGPGYTPWDYTFLNNLVAMKNYDMILFPCQGDQYLYNSQAALETNIANYVNAGGRVFATHFSYIWFLTRNYSGYPIPTYSSPFSAAVNWSINQASPTPDPQLAYIDTGFAKGALLSQWLLNAGLSPAFGRMNINTLRHDFETLVAPSQRWIYLGNGVTQHFTFNAPLGVPAEQQCGRVAFSDWHVENSNDSGYPFPTECNGGAMNPQEKLLEFMLFDLASCIQPDQTTTPCPPMTCAAQGLNCGQAGDGCGATINCGTCTAPNTCGGGGVQGVCGTPKVFNEAWFVRDYDASNACAPSKSPVWALWSWNAITPSDTHLDFKVQTASTLADLNTAPSDQVLFSDPPGPASLMATTNWTGLTPAGAAVAHALGLPLSTMPDTQAGSVSIGYTLKKYNRPISSPFLRILVHFAPSSDKFLAPTLSSWNMTFSCQDSL